MNLKNLRESVLNNNSVSKNMNEAKVGHVWLRVEFHDADDAETFIETYSLKENNPTKKLEAFIDPDLLPEMLLDFKLVYGVKKVEISIP